MVKMSKETKEYGERLDKYIREMKIMREYIKQGQKEYLEKTNIKNAPKEKEDIWDEYNYR